MQYNQVIQKSRIYEYGEGKEFKTRQEALEKVQEVKKLCVPTKAALLKIFEYLKETEIVEKDKTFQLVVTFEIPSIFE